MKLAPCSTNRFTVLEVEECSEDIENLCCSANASSSLPTPQAASEITLENQDIQPDPAQILLRSSHLRRSTELKIFIETIDSHRPMSSLALLDSGATGCFIDEDFIKSRNITAKRLPRPIALYNIDGTLNEYGSVKETVDLVVRYQDHTERLTFYVTCLGGSDLILGHTWLVAHNPEIDWVTGKVAMSRCPESCRVEHIRAQRLRRQRQKRRKQSPTIASVDAEDSYASSKAIQDLETCEKGDQILVIPLMEPASIHIYAFSAISTHLAEADAAKQDKKPLEDMIPTRYCGFHEVFSKDSFDELPGKCKWDHTIEIIPGSSPTACKLYPMSSNEQKELDNFLDENLKSGRIRPLKSPMSSPVFFVKKKDGSLRFVQDYRKLNSITIKNSYPLPLVQDMISRISGSRYFSSWMFAGGLITYASGREMNGKRPFVPIEGCLNLL